MPFVETISNLTLYILLAIFPSPMLIFISLNGILGHVSSSFFPSSLWDDQIWNYALLFTAPIKTLRELVFSSVALYVHMVSRRNIEMLGISDIVLTGKGSFPWRVSPWKGNPFGSRKTLHSVQLNSVTLGLKISSCLEIALLRVSGSQCQKVRRRSYSKIT